MSDSADGGDTKLQDAVDKVTIFCVKEDQVMTYVAAIVGMWFITFFCFALHSYIRHKRLKLEDAYVEDGLNLEEEAQQVMKGRVKSKRPKRS